MPPGAPRPACAVAWVESPLQLLSAAEAHAAGLLGGRTRVVVRAGNEPLTQTAGALDGMGLPPGLELRSEREVRRPTGPVAGTTWVVGDAFSGRVQRALALHGAERAVLVDDGLGALHLLDLLSDPARPPLTRARAEASVTRSALGAVAGYRLRRLADRGRLTAVTSLPVPERLRATVEGCGVPVARHAFAWLRSQPAGPPPQERTVVLGSALVADGLMHAEPYLELVRRWSSDEPVAYYPHRREAPAMLRALAADPQIHVRAGALPVELTLRGLSDGHRVLSLPSTALASLRALLAGRGVSMEPHAVPDAWWTASTPAAVRTCLARCAPAGRV